RRRGGKEEWSEELPITNLLLISVKLVIGQTHVSHFTHTGVFQKRGRGRTKIIFTQTNKNSSSRRMIADIR
ncbi:MAG: hypothetical protein PHF13_06815, partial [Acholeplasmataceae bacterium]|nr:hypothetical protein [Acholeplasmataceae bacterium]